MLLKPKMIDPRFFLPFQNTMRRKPPCTRYRVFYPGVYIRVYIYYYGGGEGNGRWGKEINNMEREGEKDKIASKQCKLT